MSQLCKKFTHLRIVQTDSGVHLLDTGGPLIGGEGSKVAKALT
jgi:hypothetical protein